MAEIKIEKKKPVWPWIILALIVVAVLFFLFADNDNNEQENVNNTEAVVDDTVTRNEVNNTASTDNKIEEYTQHIGDRSKMGIDHKYTNNAIFYLIDAVQEKADQLNMNLDVELKKAKEEARYITEDPEATNHAESIKNAGTTITKALRKMQDSKFPDQKNEVDEVETAVNKIDPSVLTLDQKENVNRFFKEAADVLQKMNKNKQS